MDDILHLLDLETERLKAENVAAVEEENAKAEAKAKAKEKKSVSSSSSLSSSSSSSPTGHAADALKWPEVGKAQKEAARLPMPPAQARNTSTPSPTPTGTSSTQDELESHLLNSPLFRKARRTAAAPPPAQPPQPPSQPPQPAQPLLLFPSLGDRLTGYGSASFPPTPQPPASKPASFAATPPSRPTSAPSPVPVPVTPPAQAPVQATATAAAPPPPLRSSFGRFDHVFAMMPPTSETTPAPKIPLTSSTYASPSSSKGTRHAASKLGSPQVLTPPRTPTIARDSAVLSPLSRWRENQLFAARLAADKNAAFEDKEKEENKGGGGGRRRQQQGGRGGLKKRKFHGLGEGEEEEEEDWLPGNDDVEEDDLERRGQGRSKRRSR